jgi:hypothetical protein
MTSQHRSTFVLCLLVGLAGSHSRAAEATNAVAPAGQVASPAEIASWIAALDDNQYQVREQATQHLITAGSAALDPLLAVANSDRPEPADRAIWIMRRLGGSRDNDLAVAALEHLAQLKGRPAVVAKAEADLDELGIAACERRLTPLGAELVHRVDRIDFSTMGNVLQVRLDANWHGTPEDLRMLAKLPRQLYFDLEGAAFDDAVAKMFESKQKLAFIKFTNSKVSPAAIDSLKQKHPQAVVVLRNRAMLGVSGQTHKSGVLVTMVQPGTAAAVAGIVVGDVIATIDGQPLPDFDRLTVRVAQHQPGDKLAVEIIRGEQKLKISVTLGSWSNEG